jgi:hypothetical protein
MDIGRELRVIQVAKATNPDVAFEMGLQTERKPVSHEESAECVNGTANVLIEPNGAEGSNPVQGDASSQESRIG